MAETLVGGFLDLARSQPDAPAVIEKRFGRWVERAIGELADDAAALAAGLTTVGVGTGHTVALIMRARFEWIALDLAIQAVGARSLALSSRLRPVDLTRLLAESDAATVVVEGQDEADVVLASVEAGELPGLTRIIYVDPAGVSEYSSELLHSIDEVRATGGDLGSMVEALDAAATAVLLLAPAGGFVEVAHATLLASARSTVEAVGLDAKDRVVAARDAADPVERGATIYAALLSGAMLAIPESRSTIESAIQEIAPTYVHVTERWLAHKAARITVRFDENRGIKAGVAASWRKRTGSTLEHYGSGRSPRGLWRFVVSVPVLEELGLEKAQTVMVSGDPLPRELLGFYQALGLPLHTALGVPELAGVATIGAPVDADGWVGSPVPGVSAAVEDSMLVVTSDSTGRIDTGLAASAADGGFVANGSGPEQAAETRLRAIPAFSTAIVSPGGSSVLIELDAAIASRWAVRNHLDAATYRSFSTLDEMRREVESVVASTLERFDLVAESVEILTTPLDEIPGALSFGDSPRRDLIAQ